MFKTTIDFLKKIYKEKYNYIVKDHNITIQIRIPKTIYKRIGKGVLEGNKFGVTSKEKFIREIISVMIDDMDDYKNIFNQMEEVYKEDKIRRSVSIKLTSLERANEILINDTRKGNKFLVACLYKYFKNLDSK